MSKIVLYFIGYFEVVGSKIGQYHTVVDLYCNGKNIPRLQN